MIWKILIIVNYFFQTDIHLFSE